MSLQVWLPLNGDLHNQGLSNITVTSYGSPTVNSNGKIGRCYSFDGTDDYLSLDGLNFGDLSEFSIAFWCKPTNASLINAFQIKASGNVAFQFGDNSFYFRDSAHSTLTSVSFNTPVAEEWAHYTFVYNKGNWRIYKNGETDGNGFTATQTATFYSNTTVCYVCSRRISAGNYYFDGLMNDVRIYNHALSLKEVEEIAKGLVLHYKLNGENQILVPSGYQQLEYIESTGTQYIDTGLSMPKGFKLKTKISFNDLSASSVVVAANTGDSSDYKRNYFGISTASSQKRFAIGHGSNSGSDSSPGYTYITTATTNTDYVIDVSNIYGNRYCIINGENYTISTTNTENTYTDLSLALFGTHTGSNFIPSMKGKMYYSQIYDYQNTCVFYGVPAKHLSDNVLGVYDVITKTFFTNAGTGTFTAGPNVSITGQTIYDSSGYSNNGTIVGSLTAAAGSPRYDCATYIDGTGPYINSKNRLSFITNNSPFTIAIWAYCEDWTTITASSGKFIIQQYNSTNGGFRIYSASGVNKYRIYWVDTNGTARTVYFSANNALTTGWYFFTATYDGAVMTTYLNGKRYTSATYSYKNTTAAPYFLVGNGASSVPGKYADCRFYATALTATQVKELYTTSMSIDSSGNIHARELVEL